MINPKTAEKKSLKITTVKEKILLEKQLPFNPSDKRGPTIDLYFHELPSEKSIGQKILYFLGSVFVGLFFLLTLPIIALFIKVSAGGQIFEKVKVPGKRGKVFQQYRYTITYNGTQQPFAFGTFLRKSRLEKLPSIINLWKSEMDLVGPRPYPAEWCNKWNKKLSDFYKRFALNPGFFSIARPVSHHENTKGVARSLKKEFNYILEPSLKNDILHLLNIR